MDKISEMLITIKNAGMAEKSNVSIPYSNLSHAIAKCLSDKNYVGSVSKKTGKKDRDFLEVNLVYIDGKPKISDVQRISKPSRRVYIKSKELKPFKNGYGLLVLSTPKGILTSDEARKELVGGEVLFKVW